MHVVTGHISYGPELNTERLERSHADDLNTCS